MRALINKASPFRASEAPVVLVEDGLRKPSKAPLEEEGGEPHEVKRGD